MGKGKKGGKRMNKAQLTEMLQEFFAERPGETLSFKEIFRSLRLTTHPLKMLAIDIMEEMAWDDYLAKVSDNSYRLNQSIQVMEGKFIRKANGKNSVIPDNSEKPIFVSERNSMGALNGDRVEFTFLARRKNHIKEAQVNKILERAKDTFVGRLKVDKDLAYLVTPSDVFAHNIIIPRRKVKGGKTDDKAVVRIIEWPDGENKSPIGEVVDILGQMGDNDVEMNSILAQYGLPYKYPKNVEDAANKISGEITEKDYKEREDFRKVFTCTIDFLNKKRGKNNGTLPQYYIEDDHEAIIPKELFMRVQEEMARRSTENSRKRRFSSNHAFSQIVFCSECEEIYKRLHWNNRGSKYIVWRCLSHLHEKKTCNSRTVREDVLQDAFLEAVNQIVGNSREYLKILQQNLELAIKQVNPASVEYLDARMEDLQRELIDRTERHENYDDLAEEILRLRQLREQTVMDDVSKAEYQSRIKELQAFIQSQPKRLTFDDTLVKHLLARITIFPEHLLFEFKSGVNITIEK